MTPTLVILCFLPLGCSEATRTLLSDSIYAASGYDVYYPDQDFSARQPEGLWTDYYGAVNGWAYYYVVNTSEHTLDFEVTFSDRSTRRFRVRPGNRSEVIYTEPHIQYRGSTASYVN